MASSPSARVTPCVPPFSSIGVDYFGPMLVKSRRSQVNRLQAVPFWIVEVARNSRARKNWSERAEGGLGERREKGERPTHNSQHTFSWSWP